jgi:hypothetical protein
MTYRRLVVVVVGVFMLGWAVSGCSTESSQAGVPDATGTSGQNGAAFLDLQITTFGLMATNQVGKPLNDVTVTIKPVGYPLLYTTRVRRMESGEKRELSFGAFLDRDGQAFSLRTVRPKEIVATAVDLGGTQHDMTIPWRK